MADCGGEPPSGKYLRVRAGKTQRGSWILAWRRASRSERLSLPNERELLLFCVRDGGWQWWTVLADESGTGTETPAETVFGADPARRNRASHWCGRSGAKH